MKISVFWNVPLCHWVNRSWYFKDCSTSMFHVRMWNAREFCKTRRCWCWRMWRTRITVGINGIVLN